MSNDGGMSPEDFGLGSDFDDALAEASGDGGAKEKDGGGGGAPMLAGEDAKLPRMDFSKLKMILDIPLKVSVELGRTKMLVNDLLQLGQGSVIELDGDRFFRRDREGPPQPPRRVGVGDWRRTRQRAVAPVEGLGAKEDEVFERSLLVHGAHPTVFFLL